MKSAHISNLFFLILCILPSLTLLIIYGYRYWYTFSLTLSSTRCKLNFSNIAYLYTILEYGANSYIFCLIRQISSIKHNSRSPSLSHKKSTSDFSQWNKFEVLIFLLPLAGLEPARGEPLDFESSASANSATAAWYGLAVRPFKIISFKILYCNNFFPISKQSNVAK